MWRNQVAGGLTDLLWFRRAGNLTPLGLAANVVGLGAPRKTDW